MKFPQNDLTVTGQHLQLLCFRIVSIEITTIACRYSIRSYNCSKLRIYENCLMSTNHMQKVKVNFKMATDHSYSL
ncbi:hypothetical protein AQUCO_00900716v1 [Aquilegia coerulea]|uniref:Uncharacterized protein n=1 Tax=Aquilegia coerulea TaxID=218851 RepID=A0A2G5EFL7_AQUCA|nr:hypothetical protein AQUCO_00900716v1 [Aquilegia coerulea]